MISRFTRGYEVVAADIVDLSVSEDSEIESKLSRYCYTVDEQGSTVFITDKNQQVKNEYYYDAFGNVLESKEKVHNRITYTGQQFDGITGQYYLRARFYNPVVGRFTQEDIYRGDGLNLYAYCKANPVAYYDPSGYARKCDTKVSAFEDDEHRMSKKDSKRYEEYWNNIRDGEKTGSLPGDVDFSGPINNNSWVLTQTGEGAHLIERANIKGRPNLQQYDTNKTPRFYPHGSSESAGEAHKRLHVNTKAQGIKLRGGNKNMSDEELLENYRKAYQKENLSGIRGDLRTPNASEIAAFDVTPGEAIDELIKWGNKKQ